MHEIVWLRHGEIEGGGAGVFYGATEYSLSKMGRKQAQEVGQKLERERFDRVYCSPLLRARQTLALVQPNIVCGQELIPKQNLEKSVRYDHRLRELDFGDLEGYRFEQIAREYPALAKQIDENWLEAVYPNGEATSDFFLRVNSFVKQELLSSHSNDTVRKSLVVTHGGVIRAALCWLLDFGEASFWRFRAEYCAIVRVEIQQDYAYLRLS